MPEEERRNEDEDEQLPVTYDIRLRARIIKGVIYGGLAVGLVIGFLFGARTAMLLFVLTLAVLVTAIALLLPVVLWLRRDPARPGQYLTPRWIGIYIFAGLMLYATGMRNAAPWVNDLLAPLLCAPGYERLVVPDVGQGGGLWGYITSFDLRPRCTGSLGFYFPRHFSHLLAQTGLYAGLVLLWLGLDTAVLRALAGRALHRLRYVATPLLFAGLLAALYAWPAPLQAVARPVNYLLTAGQGRETLLHQAVKDDDLAALRARLAAGDRVDGFPVLGLGSSNPPLYLALRLGRDEHVRVLLEHGADVTLGDSNGSTALHVAAGAGKLEMIDVLLERGAELDATNEKGNTPLFHALRSERWETARALLERGADPGAAGKAAQERILLEAVGAPPDLMRTVAASGASLEGRKKFHEYTPLLLAAAEGLWDRVVLLVELGADVNAQDADGYTALHHAMKLSEYNSGGSYTARYDAIEALLETGADPNLRDENGQTPLRRLSELVSKRSSRYRVRPQALQDDLDVVRLLVSHGADPELKDSMRRGFSAVDWAERADRRFQPALLGALQGR